MKNLILVFIAVLTFNFAHGQDKIYLKSEENIEAKILEINIDEVRYRKVSNPDGPIFTILKSDIHMILYENGESEIFKEEETPSTTVSTTNIIREKKILNGGGAKLGLIAGLPVGEDSELTDFSVGIEFTYLAEVFENVEIGGLVGYSYYFGGDYNDPYSGNYVIDDVSYIPIATSSRYYFGDRKFFAGLDLGYAIAVSDFIDGGFYYRSKFGFNLGVVNLILSYSSISDTFYNESSINGGIEFNLN